MTTNDESGGMFHTFMVIWVMLATLMVVTCNSMKLKYFICWVAYVNYVWMSLMIILYIWTLWIGFT